MPSVEDLPALDGDSLFWIYTGLIVGAGLSLYANLAYGFIPPHAAPPWWPVAKAWNPTQYSPPRGSLLLSAAWPVLLYITTEVMTWRGWPSGGGWAFVRGLSMLLVAAPVANASYHHLAGLLRYYFPDDINTIRFGPLAIDGAMLMCTAALQSRSRGRAPVRLHAAAGSDPPPSDATAFTGEPQYRPTGLTGEPGGFTGEARAFIGEPEALAGEGDGFPGEAERLTGEPWAHARDLGNFVTEFTGEPRGFTGEPEGPTGEVEEAIGEVIGGPRPFTGEPGDLIGEAVAFTGELDGLTGEAEGSAAQEAPGQDRPTDEEILVWAREWRPVGPYTGNWLIESLREKGVRIGTGRATRLVTQHLVPELLAQTAHPSSDSLATTPRPESEPLFKPLNSSDSSQFLPNG